MNLRRFNVKFTNKAKPCPVIVKNIHDQHQIDLVDMNSMKVNYNGKTYRYIFSLMDVFSRFHWLAPLERKTSRLVKKELNRIYTVHGVPKRLQSDNGGEFKGDVQKFCLNRKIKMIKSRPYNPKAQGKVERSHRVLRQKIHYDLITQTKTGVNWVKNLPKYMKCLNDDKREELGWKSAFEIYFGRKSNSEGTNEWKKCDDTITHQTTCRPSKRAYQNQFKRSKNMRDAAKRADERLISRMLDKDKRKNTYKVFEKNDFVFVRLRVKGMRRKRHRIVTGRVEKRYKDDATYLIKLDDTDAPERFRIEDIASVNNEMRKKLYQKNLLIPMTRNDRLSSFEEQGYEIVHDPIGDGNCQFASISYFLRQNGIYRSAASLRNEVIKYLNRHHNINGQHWDLFVEQTREGYLNEMTRSSTYGDELTLRVMSEVLGIQIILVSTLGPQGRVIISPNDHFTSRTVVLGHFAEGDGEHYVVLARNEDNYDHFVG